MNRKGQMGKTNHWYAWRANQWFLTEVTLLSSFSPNNSLSWTLEGLFDVTRRSQPWRVCYFRIYRDTRTLSVRCGALGAEIPRTVKNDYDEPCLCVCFKHTSFSCIKNWEGVPFAPLYDPPPPLWVRHLPFLLKVQEENDFRGCGRQWPHSHHWHVCEKTCVESIADFSSMYSSSNRMTVKYKTWVHFLDI